MKNMVLVAALAVVVSLHARAETQEPFDFVRESAAVAQASNTSRYWRDVPAIPDSAFQSPEIALEIMAIVSSKHRGVPPHVFNEVNPGAAVRIGAKRCLWVLSCYLAASYIHRNSVKGHAWTLGGGAKLNGDVGPVTLSVGLEVFILHYEYPPRSKNYTVPLGAPFIEAMYHFDKTFAVGVGEFLVPVSKGKRIEIHYLKAAVKRNIF